MVGRGSQGTRDGEVLVGGGAGTEWDGTVPGRGIATLVSGSSLVRWRLCVAFGGDVGVQECECLDQGFLTVHLCCLCC